MLPLSTALLLLCAIVFFQRFRVCVRAMRIIVVVVIAAVVFFIVAFQMFMQLHTDMHVHPCMCVCVCVSVFACLCLSSNGLQLKSPTKPHTKTTTGFLSHLPRRALYLPHMCVCVCVSSHLSLSPSLSFFLAVSLHTLSRSSSLTASLFIHHRVAADPVSCSRRAAVAKWVSLGGKRGGQRLGYGCGSRGTLWLSQLLKRIQHTACRAP